MLQAIWGSLFATLYFYLRPMIKWVLRRVTGKCELLRILYQYPPGVQRTKYIESSLKKSRNGELQRLTKEKDTNIEAAVIIVMKIKTVLPEVHASFQDSFRGCLKKISGYIKLQAAVESIRVIKYSCKNQEHEKKLLQLWAVLTNGEKLESRTCSQWTEIGFQGNDPQTDFRGMGQLGLDQLIMDLYGSWVPGLPRKLYWPVRVISWDELKVKVFCKADNAIYFTTHCTQYARAMLSRSKHPKNGYSFAIVGINMTELLFTLLRNGTLKSYFYINSNTQPVIEDYHEIYCFLFYEFDKFWFKENPKDIMEFGKLREKYRKSVVSQLKDRSVSLAGKFKISTTDSV